MKLTVYAPSVRRASSLVLWRHGGDTSMSSACSPGGSRSALPALRLDLRSSK
jgi:hypothetical protein